MLYAYMVNGFQHLFFPRKCASAKAKSMLPLLSLTCRDFLFHIRNIQHTLLPIGPHDVHFPVCHPFHLEPFGSYCFSSEQCLGTGTCISQSHSTGPEPNPTRVGQPAVPSSQLSRAAKIYLPGNASYSDATTRWNGAMHPDFGAVVVPTNDQDVAATVSYRHTAGSNRMLISRNRLDTRI